MIVFASILLSSLGISTNEVFAHGDAPSTCTNRYDGPITSAKIIVGNQTFDPIANPGVSFELATDQKYNLTFTIRTPSQSSQGNSDPGTTWYRTTAVGFALGVCFPSRSVTSVGPNQNVTISWSVSHPSNLSPSGEGIQSVDWSTIVSGFSYNVKWICPSTWSTVPCPPRNLSATAVSSSQIDLNWTPPRNEGGSPITGYRIDRNEVAPDGTWGPILTIVSNTNSTATTYSDTRLSPNTTYIYWVRAINSFGTGPNSNGASATTQGSTTSSTVTLTIRSADLSGTEFTGMWAEIWDGTTLVVEGFTPLSQAIQSGKTYQLWESDWQTITFQHWEDGSTIRERPISISHDTTVTAFFQTSSATTSSTMVTLTVDSADMAGTTFPGQWVELWRDGIIIQENFTPFSAQVESGRTYEIFIYDDPAEEKFFNNWEDGSTTRMRAITLSQDTTLTAFFQIGTQ